VASVVPVSLTNLVNLPARGAPADVSPNNHEPENRLANLQMEATRQRVCAIVPLQRAAHLARWADQRRQPGKLELMTRVAKGLAGYCALGVLLVCAVPTGGQSTIALASLTVPQNRLPAGCSLPPSDTTPLDGNRIRGGLWDGLPISSNPWHGDDRSVAAAIRERVAASPPLPDGPPLSRAELARFRLQLAEDIEEAYAAIYADAGTDRAIVYAVRFKKTPVPGAPYGARESVRIVRDGTVVVVSGAGWCSEAVATYLREQTTR